MFGLYFWCFSVAGSLEGWGYWEGCIHQFFGACHQHGAQLHPTKKKQTKIFTLNQWRQAKSMTGHSAGAGCSPLPIRAPESLSNGRHCCLALNPGAVCAVFMGVCLYVSHQYNTMGPLRIKKNKKSVWISCPSQMWFFCGPNKTYLRYLLFGSDIIKNRLNAQRSQEVLESFRVGMFSGRTACCCVHADRFFARKHVYIIPQGTRAKTQYPFCNHWRHWTSRH